MEDDNIAQNTDVPRCLNCQRGAEPRTTLFKLSPPPPRKHMNIEPFSTSSITQPKWFCRPHGQAALRHGWVGVIPPVAKKARVAQPVVSELGRDEVRALVLDMKRAREKQGLTCKYVAQMLGCDVNLPSHWERAALCDCGSAHVHWEKGHRTPSPRFQAAINKWLESLGNNR